MQTSRNQQLEGAVEGWSQVIIDLAGIEYLDGQGLGLIKQLCSKARKDGTQLQLVAPPGRFAYQVLKLARMDGRCLGGRLAPGWFSFGISANHCL